MNTIFEEQYSDLSWETPANKTMSNDQYSGLLWNEFLDTTASGFTYSNPTLQNSVDHEAPAIDTQGTIFSQISQGQATVGGLTGTSVYTDQAQQQQLLEGQPFTVESEKTEFEEVKALLEENSRYSDKDSAQSITSTDTGGRQIDHMSQHLAALTPYFEAMRSTLKTLTEQVNRQWEVKTPLSPYFNRPNTSSNATSLGSKRVKRKCVVGNEKLRDL